MFSLLTWQFSPNIDTRPFLQLLCFFAQPWKDIDTICKDIHRNYTAIVAPMPLKEFKTKFIVTLGLIEYLVTKGHWPFVESVQSLDQ